MLRAAATLLALLPALALAGERTLLLKTFEDGRHDVDLEFCRGLGYAPLNVLLGASVWSLQTNAARGVVMNEAVKFVGTATGCGSLTNPDPRAPAQPFTIKFDLGDGTYVASGNCDITSNDVPAPRLMLAGCALKLVQMPEGVVGGIATSASVFNPANLQGFGTGSVWTLHLYTAD